MNCCVLPIGMLGVAGVTAMETNVADVTLSVTAGELTLPSVAVICEVPIVKLVARPFVPAALLIVATVVLDDVQVTPVRVWWLLSE